MFEFSTTTTRFDMIPTNRTPTHPGEILLEEFLKPLIELHAIEVKYRQ